VQKKYNLTAFKCSLPYLPAFCQACIMYVRMRTVCCDRQSFISRIQYVPRRWVCECVVVKTHQTKTPTE